MSCCNSNQEVSPDATFKLIYFDARGRGETIRLIFAAAGKPFEDSRIHFNPESLENSEWMAMKSHMPFGQVPVLEITDQGKTIQLAQSSSIGRWLARRFCLAGKSTLEQAFVDMYVDQVNDVFYEKARIFWEPDQNKRAVLTETFRNETLPRNLELFEKQLAKNNTGYLIGSSMTWADLALFNFIDGLIQSEMYDENIACDKYPNVKKLKQAIQTHPNISQYLAARRKTKH